MMGVRVGSLGCHYIFAACNIRNSIHSCIQLTFYPSVGHHSAVLEGKSKKLASEERKKVVKKTRRVSTDWMRVCRYDDKVT